MKKFLVLSVFMFFTANAFASGEINAKFGLDPYGRIDTKIGKVEIAKDTQFGINISAEYLYPVHDIIKVGGGFEYLFARGTNPDYKDKYSYFPIYAAVAVNPFYFVPEAYLKANIGYIVLFDPVVKGVKNNKGGFYWGIGAGYAFDFDIIIEAIYSFYYTEYEISSRVACSYSKLGINIGYKFKI